MTNAAEADDNKDWIATLKRGSTYTLGTNPDNTMRFTRNVDTPVDEATKERLRTKAVEMIDTGDVDDDDRPVLEPKCKFDFRRKGEAAPAAPRRRVRAS